MGAAWAWAARQGVRIVVIGDPGTGKSSLVASVAKEEFPENVAPSCHPPASPSTHSGSPSSGDSRFDLRLDRLIGRRGLRLMAIKKPVILVGCKLDVTDDQQQASLEQLMASIMHTFREVDTYIECSALHQFQVPEVFCYAQKAVIHPAAPLIDHETQSLKPRCMTALNRIFILCDHDGDGALSDVELNKFQVRCFNTPLQPDEITGVKRFAYFVLYL
ncbi:hypothetical protein E2562_034168 [Oryza meyeriana var. granulata]|uniref:EF-hand domain-containing protein n=1 Tax=Oryza meyeriana var. granulata TaxID=110450 RepID=A0A6G1ESF6_9ORYZ|nr:hypothetical protein E2562_034168 [Oryza meyeriana var. granulata]